MEHWNRAYREAPEIFDAFSNAEDPDGLVVRKLLDTAGLDGRSVLEIGCGTGRYTEAIAGRAGRYLAIEKSPRMLSLARRRLGPATANSPRLICATAERLPLRSESIDLAIAGWVLVNLPRASRATAIRELDRVLTRGELRAGSEVGATWLLENHWSGEFQQLRDRQPAIEQGRVRELMQAHGFRLVDTVETELRFPSAAEAERILGYLCGEAVRDRLHRQPRSRFSHHVVILRRPAPA